MVILQSTRKREGKPERLREAEKDLDKACLMSLTSTAEFVRASGKYLDNDTVLAMEYLEKIIEEKEKHSLEG